MAKVKLDNLREGMVVTADVRNLDDMLLFPAGTELSARHLKVMRSWGISEVRVEDGDEVEDVSDPLRRLSPESLAQLEENLRSIFWKFDDSQPLQQTVYRLMLMRQVRRLPNRHVQPS